MTRRAIAIRGVRRRRRHVAAIDARAVRSAASDALAAYRGIFGRSCWNARDREAFARLERALAGSWSTERIARMGMLIARSRFEADQRGPA